MGIFDFMKKNMKSKVQETNAQPAASAEKAARATAPFYLEVCGKYSAYGGMFAEGYIRYGQLRIGDTVSVYSEKGKVKYERTKVIAILDSRGIKTDSAQGEGTYMAICLDGVQNIGDYDPKDIISTEKQSFENQHQEAAPENKKVMPEPKTYNDPDRRTHVNMATNDIASMCASGRLASNRDWVRNVGQDLYDAHGFEAMQEVFINVKTRYPSAQSQLSSIWDGVGGWAD